MTGRSPEFEVVDVPVIAIAVGVPVASTLPVVLVAAVAPMVTVDLGFGAGGLGIASAVFFGVGAATAAWSGRLTQMLGVTHAMRATTLLSAVAMAAMGIFADSLVTLCGYLALAGFANTIAHPSANWALTLASPVSRRALMFGIKQAAIPIASLLGGMSVPLLAVRHGWRMPLLVGAFAAAALTLAVPRGLGPPPTRRARRRERPSPGMWILVMAGALGSSAGVSIGTFLVDSAVTAGWSASAAGQFLAVCGGLGVCVRIGSGWIVDRWQIPGRRALASLMGGGAVGLVIVVSATGTTILLGAGMLLAYGAGWGWGGLVHHVVASENPHAIATATGYAQAGILTGGALGPLGFGVLVEATSYATAWAVAAVVLAVAALILIMAGHGRRDVG